MLKLFEPNQSIKIFSNTQRPIFGEIIKNLLEPTELFPNLKQRTYTPIFRWFELISSFAHFAHLNYAQTYIRCCSLNSKGKIKWR